MTVRNPYQDPQPGDAFVLGEHRWVVTGSTALLIYWRREWPDGRVTQNSGRRREFAALTSGATLEIRQ